ncbi:MAG: LPXTG cell wall anchor domain-containing protein [Acidimicrobiia bacterium]
MHNRWAFGLGALALSSGAFITLAPLVSAEPITSLGAFTSPTPNSQHVRGELLTLRLTQTSHLLRESGSTFPAVAFTSDTGCVNAAVFDTVYTRVDERDISVTTPVLPGAKPGPCTITAEEQDGAKDTESVTIEIVEPAVTAQPSEVAGTDVTNPSAPTTVPGVSSVTVAPSDTTTAAPGVAAATTVPAPQVAGVTVAPNQVANGSLPRTGSSPMDQVWLGVLLLGAGAVFTALAKRSQASRSA